MSAAESRTAASVQSGSRTHSSGSRRNSKVRKILMPTVMAVGGGVMLQQANLTAVSCAAAVLALAAAPALWQLSRRIRRFSRSTDGVMLMEFDQPHGTS
jgi:hypothetical protein